MVEVTGATVEECHKRNIHNRSLADIQQAAAQWQQTPAVYPLLDLGPLLGLNKKKSKQVSLSRGLNLHAVSVKLLYHEDIAINSTCYDICLSPPALT